MPGLRRRPLNGSPFAPQTGTARTPLTMASPVSHGRARERPFILRWRSAVFNSELPAVTKQVLIALAEWADVNGGSCWPSMASVAELSSLNERTVRRVLERPLQWVARTTRPGAGGRGWRTYSYRLLIPEGADCRPARSTRRAGGVSAPPYSIGSHTRLDDRASREELTGTKSGELGRPSLGLAGRSETGHFDTAGAAAIRLSVDRINQDHHLGIIDIAERNRRLRQLAAASGDCVVPLTALGDRTGRP